MFDYILVSEKSMVDAVFVGLSCRRDFCVKTLRRAKKTIGHHERNTFHQRSGVRSCLMLLATHRATFQRL